MHSCSPLAFPARTSSGASVGTTEPRAGDTCVDMAPQCYQLSASNLGGHELHELSSSRAHWHGEYIQTAGAGRLSVRAEHAECIRAGGERIGCQGLILLNARRQRPHIAVGLVLADLDTTFGAHEAGIDALAIGTMQIDEVACTGTAVSAITSLADRGEREHKRATRTSDRE